MARTSPHLTAQAQAHEEDQEKEDGKSIPHLRFVHGLSRNQVISEEEQPLPSQVPQPTCYWQLTFMAVGEPDYRLPCYVFFSLYVDK